MVYNVIGLMSGSSLDGLDLAFVTLTEISGKWSYELVAAACMPYTEQWKHDLRNAAQMTVPEYLKLDTRYGHYLAQQVNAFIAQNQLEHKVHFIASHGHTTWHEPAAGTTAQIGDSAAIAAHTLLPVIANLRSMDVALGGQGAPIVPIADRHLLSEYHFCLNLGGIANITVNQPEPIAFDICPANQLLNFFAEKEGLQFDDDGALAAQGVLDQQALDAANNADFYQLPAPKSLHNGFSIDAILPLLQNINSTNNALHTACHHIAAQIAKAIEPFANPLQEQTLLITGGGAHNTFLVNTIQQYLSKLGDIMVVVPDEGLVNYKEAIAMALIGALRWREEVNVLSSVTGATINSVNGAIWVPPID